MGKWAKMKEGRIEWTFAGIVGLCYEVASSTDQKEGRIGHENVEDLGGVE